MNRAAIGTATRQITAQLGTGYVTGTILANAIDRAARRLNRESKYNKGDVSVGLTAGTQDITLSGTTLEVYRVRTGTGSHRKRLTPTDVHLLDKNSGDWEAATAGEPTEYYVDGKFIGFRPKPYRASLYATATRYTTTQYIVPRTDNEHIYKCTTAGTTSATEPTWPTTSGSHATAGTVAFMEYGPSKAHLRCLQTPSSLANATSTPSWCPVDYHDTIAKGAAIDLAGGFDADAENAPVRVTRLYQEYLAEVADLRRLSTNRSREYTSRLSPTGYGTFRR